MALAGMRECDHRLKSQAIREGLSGNLCRCTGYVAIEELASDERFLRINRPFKNCIAITRYPIPGDRVPTKMSILNRMMLRVLELHLFQLGTDVRGSENYRRTLTKNVFLRFYFETVLENELALE